MKAFQDTEKNLHWLPIPARIQYKIILTTWKTIHKMALGYLSKLIKVNENSRVLRSNSTIRLKMPQVTCKNMLIDLSFCMSAPSLWNGLPDDLKSIETLDGFKKKLKTYLFNRFYD